MTTLKSTNRSVTIISRADLLSRDGKSIEAYECLVPTPRKAQQHSVVLPPQVHYQAIRRERLNFGSSK